jgi:hypothetical protein
VTLGAIITGIGVGLLWALFAVLQPVGFILAAADHFHGHR